MKKLIRAMRKADVEALWNEERGQYEIPRGKGQRIHARWTKYMGRQSVHLHRVKFSSTNLTHMKDITATGVGDLEPMKVRKQQLIEAVEQYGHL